MTTPLHQGQIAGTQWNPGQYLKFSDHRLRPALELLDRIPAAQPDVIYDLGAGTGSVTRHIAERWPSATVYGLDSSKEMIQQASADPGRVTWIEADIRTWQPDAPVDIIYSNATLQWLDNHDELFPRLVSLVKPGGFLAVQVPLSMALRSHVLMRETLENAGPNGTPLGTEEFRQAVVRDWVAPAEVYYDLLVGITKSLDIWETEYLQTLEGPDPVLEWVKGTGLRPFLNGLNDSDRAVFLAEYTRRLRVEYPVRADGRTLYPFRRLFIVAAV